MATKESAFKNGRSFPPYSEHPAVLSRTRYPHEVHYSWLPILLDSYAILDYEIQLDVKKGMRTKGQSIACHKGCFGCCTRQEILLTLLEFMGISWFYSEICDVEIKKGIKPQLLSYKRRIECPFLLANVCSIYHVRPLVCRGFFVYGKPCGLDEDVAVKRPEDIHPPNREIGRYVVFRLLDYPDFGCPNIEAKERAFNEGIIVNISKPMHEWDWVKYVELSESRFG